MSATRPRAWLALVCTAALMGCATRTPPLYEWGEFSKIQYDALRAHGTPSAEHIVEMEALMHKAAASHAALPPGFRAHLGMLKLANGDPEQARTLWQSEKAAFPEATPYMDQLLKRLDAPAKQEPQA